MKTYQIKECCGLCKYWGVGTKRIIEGNNLPECQVERPEFNRTGRGREANCDFFEIYISFNNSEILGATWDKDAYDEKNPLSEQDIDIKISELNLRKRNFRKRPGNGRRSA